MTTPGCHFEAKISDITAKNLFMQHFTAPHPQNRNCFHRIDLVQSLPDCPRRRGPPPRSAVLSLKWMGSPRKGPGRPGLTRLGWRRTTPGRIPGPTPGPTPSPAAPGSRCSPWCLVPSTAGVWPHTRDYVMHICQGPYDRVRMTGGL